MTAQAFAAECIVSRETMARLEIYDKLLAKWNPAINLVAKSTLADVWSRHFLDSAQIFALAPQKALHWVDLGSGGGFPGLVVAILALEQRPELRVTLVESDQRKATFLRTVAREVGAAVIVESVRVEQLTPQNADILSARALAPLAQLCGFAERHLAHSGTGIFLKGANAQQEIDEALALWRFEVQKTISKTDPSAVILTVQGIARA